MVDAVRVLVRGGGDLASGVAARLHRSGFHVLVTELFAPLVVRRRVSFTEAVFTQVAQVEELTARLAGGIPVVGQILAAGEIAVMVDPQLASLTAYGPQVLIDARMRKRPPETDLSAAPLVVGLGPGFTAGEDCHAVIETMRGHRLGRVIWQGAAQADTGEPDPVMGRSYERVLRAPADGRLVGMIEIGERVSAGQAVASVAGEAVQAPFDGVLRGLVHSGLEVRAGMKIGDLDPRQDPEFAFLISDKALAIGGGVLEAILSRSEIRKQLYAPD
jgi:xanthine dehydrogenase accessory factor